MVDTPQWSAPCDAEGLEVVCWRYLLGQYRLQIQRAQPDHLGAILREL